MHLGLAGAAGIRAGRRGRKARAVGLKKMMSDETVSHRLFLDEVEQTAKVRMMKRNRTCWIPRTCFLCEYPVITRDSR